MSGLPGGMTFNSAKSRTKMCQVSAVDEGLPRTYGEACYFSVSLSEVLQLDLRRYCDQFRSRARFADYLLPNTTRVLVM